MKDGRPDGFVRVIYESGQIYEGFMISQKFYHEGFGRQIYKDGTQYIGWWSKSHYHGNGLKTKKNGETVSEGWFENGKQKGPFDKKIHEYIEHPYEYMI